MHCLLSALATLVLAVPALAQEPSPGEGRGARVERHDRRLGERERMRLRVRIARLRHALREHRLEHGERALEGRERLRELERGRDARRRALEGREPGRGRESLEERGPRDRRDGERGPDPRARRGGDRKDARDPQARGRSGRQRKSQR